MMEAGGRKVREVSEAVEVGGAPEDEEWEEEDPALDLDLRAEDFLLAEGLDPQVKSES